MEDNKAGHIERVLRNATGLECSVIQDAYGMFCMELPVNQIYATLLALYRDPELGFNFLTDLCGMHDPDKRGKELCVVYHVQSMTRRERLRIKAFASEDQPEFPSITGIYATANWMERETYDFYGIRFLGHPDLRRILNMDEMVDFPMRREFPLEDPLREDKADYQFGR
ncbi:MAG: NADH-quinone oxidoreductase subunit C [Saprospiraceae bacterium]|jgi:NADH-quinone oxidoreductase subunit C|nr:NADH-quinone oxidoreductase subunit C [Saprospiraceae bacterium]MBP9210327.1 NADH-quinone oxidoreductase subunit C [Saprospiraceae bacterium]MBV6474024.1 NAD(P)H-quinone oxidoreductase subunit J, chloroplastic [Saprospiraceae bacterium]